MSVYDARYTAELITMLTQQFDNFCRTWQPDDNRDRARFSADLYSLLQLQATVTQAPLTKQLCDVMAHTPVVFSVKTDK